MATQMYIDGIDVLATYKAYPLGYEGLLTWAQFKAIHITEWPDEDGVDANLINPKLDAQQLSLNVAVRDDSLEDFMEFVYSSHTHTYYFPELGLTKALRLVGCGDMEVARKLGIVTLMLSDDIPLKDYTYVAPLSSVELAHLADRLFVDGVDVIDYGCVALEGVRNPIKAYPNAKDILITNASNRVGISADNEASVHTVSRQIIIPLLLRATTIEEFWQNYNALYHNITRSGARELELVGELPVECYYQSMSVESFSLPRFSGDTVWMQFSITFSTTMPIYGLLSESGEAIVSEDLSNKIAIR